MGYCIVVGVLAVRFMLAGCRTPLAPRPNVLTRVHKDPRRNRGLGVERRGYAVY